MKDKLFRLAGNCSWSAAAQISEKALRFISLPLLLAAYGRESYGLVAIVFAIRGYLSLLNLGTPMGLVKYAAQWLHGRDPEKLERCSRTSLSLHWAIGVVNAGVFAALAIWGSHLFKVSEGQVPLLRNLFLIAAIYALFFWPAQLVDQLLTAAEDIQFVQKLSGVRSLLEFACTIYAVLYDLRLDTYFAVRSAAPLLLAPFRLWRWSRHGSARQVLLPGWYWREFQPVILYGLGVISIGVFHTTFLEFRPILLGIRGPSVGTTADFMVLSSIVSVLLMAGNWVFDPLVPAASRALADGDRRYLDFITFRLSKYFWAATCLAWVCVVSSAPSLLKLYVGESYVHLAHWLILLSFSVVDLYMVPVSAIIFASGRLRPYIISNAVLGLLGLVILWGLAPSLGVGGAVLGTGIYYLCQLAFHHFYYLPRVMGIASWKLFRSAFLRPLMMAAGTAGALMLGQQFLRTEEGLWRLVANATTAIPVAGLLTYFLVLDAEERKGLTELLSRRAAMLLGRSGAGA